ncbi:uncharacterized protein LOC116177923 [Photinus pyralis]|uniref:uncharacterized protein LOC116177923 n=1 Tax=Photinus pyralis TaxID=7054 RepID=UPI001266F51D|nr:uncharacterized protein LOC116177923 [Photinus pyralis]
MSVDIENGTEESEEQEKEQEVRKTWKSRLVYHWPVAFKISELILSALCLGLIYEPVDTVGMGNTRLHHIGVMYTAYTGSMVIIFGILIGRCLRDQLGYRTSFVFSCSSAALFLTTGVLLTADRAELTKDHFFHPSRYLLNMMTAAVVLTFVNCVVFAADAVVTFIRRQDF